MTTFDSTAGTSELLDVSTTTAVATAIGAIGTDDIGSLAVGSDGTLYGLSDSTEQIVSISTTTGALTALGSVENATQPIEAIATAPAPTSTSTPVTSDSALTPTIGTSTLPATVAAGGTPHARETVDLANGGTATVTGRATVQVFASADGSIDASSTPVGTATARLHVAAGRSQAVVVPIKSIPAALNGNYVLLAEVTDPAGDTGVSVEGPAVTVAAATPNLNPYIVSTTLPAAVVGGTKTKATVRLQIVDDGNATNGKTTIALYASTGESTGNGTLIRTLTESVPLKPGAQRFLTVPLLAIPAVPAGTYTLVAQVTDSHSGVSTAFGSGTFTISPAFSSLVPAKLAFKTPANGSETIRVGVTNEGSAAAPAGTSTIALTTSISSDDTNPVTVLTAHQSLPLAAGKTRFIVLKLTASQAKAFTANSFAFVVVTDPAGQVQMVQVSGEE